MSDKLKGFSYRIAPFLASFFLLLLAALLFWQNAEVQKAASRAYRVCLGSLVPTLFPFMILGDLWNRIAPSPVSRSSKQAPFPFFRSLGRCVLQGAFLGFPIAAAAATAEVERNRCSLLWGAKALLLSNNPGPAFLIAGVGAGLFKSWRLGALFYLCNWFSSALTLLLLNRWISVSKAHTSAPAKDDALSMRMRYHAINMLSVCGCVLFFSIICGVLSAVLPTTLSNIIVSLSEIGSAAAFFSAVNTQASLLFFAFATGFGGFSVFLQTLPYLSALGLSPKTYFIYKALQGGILTCLIALALRFPSF